MSLLAERRQVEGDVADFSAWALDEGWGDGLPLVPPTEERVLEHVAASGRPATDILGVLAPADAECSVEHAAINAVMAGAPAAAMPLICAAIEATADPAFDLRSVNTTTASVVPGLFVNGQIRHDLSIPFGGGCFGGVASASVAIGRAVRLIMRNVAGQVIGTTSESMYGQPGRVTGIVVGEWEERSPWAPLAERRGVAGDAVTVFGTMGTMNIVDNIAPSGDVLLQIIGISLAYPGANGFPPQQAWSEVMTGINPIWAGRIAEEYPNIEDVQERLWSYARHPIDRWPAAHQERLEEVGRVKDGHVHLVPTPDHVIVMVCGGLGNLHSIGLHGSLPNRAITRAVTA